MLDLAKDDRSEPMSQTPSAPTTEPSRISPSLVASTFIEQYYKTLSNAPQHIYLFYNQDSVFVRLELGDVLSIDSEAKLTVVGQVAIHERIRQLDYKNCKVLIDTIDFQDSIDGSVIVLVTGLFSNNGLPPRAFVQSVVLARQERGYYVRNDILRYLQRQANGGPCPDPELQRRANGGPCPAPEVQRRANGRPVPASALTTPQNVQQPGASVETQKPIPDIVSDAPLFEEDDDTQPEETGNVAVSTESQGLVETESSNELAESQPDEPVPNGQMQQQQLPPPAPAKPTSWAALFSGSAPPAQPPALVDRAPPVPKAASVPTATTTSEPTERRNQPDFSCHLFVQNIPDGTTEFQIANIFSPYGVVVHAEIQPKRSFAFVIFESPDGVTAALKAKSISFQGQELSVSQRRARGAINGRGGRGGGTRGRARHVPRGGGRPSNQNS